MVDPKNSQQILWIIILFVGIIFLGSLFLLIDRKITVILLSLGVFFLWLSYRYPRLGLILFLCYIPWGGTLVYSISGTFVKQGAEIAISNDDYFLFQLVKDFFYFPAVLALFLLFRGQFKKYNSLNYLFLALFASCILTFVTVNLNQAIFHNNWAYIPVGLIGFKIILGYIPLVFCAYFGLRTKEDLIFLMRILVVVIIIACTLCFIQFFLLTSGICPGNVNLLEPASTKATLQARCFVGGSLLYNPAKDLLRLPGTFASPWHWAWFLISSAFLAYGITLSDPLIIWRIIGIFSTLLVFTTSVISGQRTALLLVPIIFVVLLIITEKKRHLLIQKLALITCLGILSFGKLGFLQERVQNLGDRWNYSSPIDFVAGQFEWLLNGRLSLLGEGIGTATSGARVLKYIELIETFQVKIIYEIGILGGLIYFALMLTLLILTFRAYRRLQDPTMRQLSLCLWSFLVLISVNPYYYPLAVDPVNIYYWLIGGILLKLPEIESQRATKDPSEELPVVD